MYLLILRKTAIALKYANDLPVLCNMVSNFPEIILWFMVIIITQDIQILAFCDKFCTNLAIKAIDAFHQASML